MPRLTRPDGVELHWEQRGSGPPVVISLHWAAHPRVLEPLAADLAADHRVVTYHRRGTGESTRTGPYDRETDAGDLTAIAQEADAIEGVLFGTADAADDVIRVAAREPVRAAVIATALPLGRSPDLGEALAGSGSVLQAMLGMLETSYRAGLRTMMESTNPTFTGEQVQQRVDEAAEFCDQDAGVGRLRSWIRDDVSEEARALGDRLWWLTTTDNPWYPADLAQQLPDLLPEAHVEPVADGPMNRPDLAAAIVRRITAG